ncbi:MAG: hypothetical protein M1830_004517 [Pleopsidium flavum]|nr:MAG: hypothetical protein M1830_004517 [Pleopsidium flavum]
MELCELCQGITLAGLVTKTGYLHRQSFEALQLSANQCDLCNLFLCATLSAFEPKDIVQYLEKYSYQSQIDLKACDGPFFEPGQLERLSTLVIHVETLGIATLSLYTDAAARWIEDCVTNHVECSLVDPSSLPSEILKYRSPLPTRVIDVGSANGSQSPFLYESANQFGTYVTLSHCWGKTPTLTTEAITLQERKNGIELSTLSNTFRDALCITRGLGLRYLWIDALCIIQDSPQDWQRESSRMGEVYRNALFTISATGAEDSHKGCFQKRSAPPLESVKIDCHLDDGTDCKVYLRLPTDHSDTNSFYDDGQAAPLNDRAWCLQERLLSRRVLHYGKEQMFWECHKLSLLEDGSQCEGWSWKKRGFAVMRTCNLEQLSQDQVDQVTGAVYTDWRSTIKRYTARKLTRGTDKLPGLSGVANMIQMFTGDQYLAGLWRKDLPWELIWSASFLAPLARPATYRAPSWSWSSVDGPVEYPVIDLNTSSAVEIIDTQIELLGHDKHGQVKGGWIKISGALVFATGAAENRAESNAAAAIIDAKILNESGHETGSCDFDVEESVPRPVACLLIRLRNGPSPQFRCLILEATGDVPDEYRRIGTGILRTVPAAVEMKTIIIV